MLSDSSVKKAMKSGRARPQTGVTTNKHYSDRQKIEAATAYLMLGGNAALTAASLKMEVQTLHLWKRSEWWANLINEIRNEEKLTLSTKLKKIVEGSWEVVANRLEHGDVIYDQKTGTLVRKPVSMKDAAKVAVDTTVLRDKLNMGEGLNTHADAIEEKLTKLAKAFTDLSRGITNNQAIETVEFTEKGTQVNV